MTISFPVHLNDEISS